jgi:hypothetical protein
VDQPARKGGAQYGEQPQRRIPHSRIAFGLQYVERVPDQIRNRKQHQLRTDQQQHCTHQHAVAAFGLCPKFSVQQQHRATALARLRVVIVHAIPATSTGYVDPCNAPNAKHDPLVPARYA